MLIPIMREMPKILPISTYSLGHMIDSALARLHHLDITVLWWIIYVSQITSNNVMHKRDFSASFYCRYVPKHTSNFYTLKTHTNTNG